MEQQPSEIFITHGNTRLFAREIGQGEPVIVLHGGPDFDHGYLLPELDWLSDFLRLIYYDQRGRGRSADGVHPEDVTLTSEIADMDGVRQHFGLNSVGLLGHSWGCLLALEYAVRRPNNVSCLILMNPAPVSRRDRNLVRERRRNSPPDDLDRMLELSSSASYRDGDPDSVAAKYRIQYSSALSRPQDIERVISRLRASFTRERILKGRAIEDRLISETLASENYDLISRLDLRIPTLVMHGEDDNLIPHECAAHIAQAIPGARLDVLKGCGHFSYLECPDTLYDAIRQFISENRMGPSSE